MPIAESTAALIAAGVAAAGQGGNMYFQGKMNRKTRQFSEEMYARQRADALADFERSSPKEMMKRYKEAGLNPHLIYGQASNAPAVRSSSQGDWNPKAPQMDLGEIATRYLDFRQRSAQTDQVKQQAELIQQEILNRKLQATGIGIDNALKSANIPYASEMSKTQLTALQTSVEKTLQEISASKTQQQSTETGTSIALQRNEREAAASAQSLVEGLERIYNLRIDRVIKQQIAAKNPLEREKLQAEIDSLKQQKSNAMTDGEIKKIDKDFKDRGVNYNSNFFMRTLEEFMEKIRRKGKAYQDNKK